MELRLRRDLFLAELSPMQGIVERRTTIPVLSHILLKAGGKSLQLAATDLDVSLTSSVARTIRRDEVDDRATIFHVAHGKADAALRGLDG